MPPTVADQNGYTLLHASAAYNKLDLAEWLLQQGADVHVKDTDGDTPLHHTDQAEAARYLIQNANADPTVTNNEGKTALQAKQEEMQELKQDPDFDDEEKEVIDLKELIGYLESVTNR